MNEFATEEFVQDFLEESGQHLRSITDNLLTLESGVGEDERSRLVNELFRSFHTLKGLCGMMGLTAAADLSHTLESILRGLRRGELEITPPLMDSLLDGTKVLEAAIATLGDPEAPVPDVPSTIAKLEEWVAAGPPEEEPAVSEEREGPAAPPPSLAVPTVPELAQALDEVDRRRVETAIRDGRHLSVAIFTPTAEKAAAGVNVNTVRQRLSEAAELIKAVPFVRDGRICFAFLLASPQPLSADDFPEVEWGAPPAPGEEVVAEVPPTPRPPPPPAAPPASAQETPAPVTPPEAKAPPAREAPPGPELAPTAEAAPPTAARPAPASRRALPATVRVDIGRLDELMRLVGDLVVSRSRLADVQPKLVGAPAPAVEAVADISDQMGRQLRDLREGVMRVRMVPLSEVFGRMPLAVRDLARETGKEVRLVMEGQETEIDKILVERLLDPMLHLVRNAITHGIEPPEERIAAGKPPEGTLTLSGRPEGDHIVITVSDDGRGVDVEKVAAKARELGWLGEDETLADDQLLDFLCRPGLSTKTEADMGAGRGVGMDVVARAVDTMGGMLSMHTAPGRGTTFTLRLPLTLAIIEAFIVTVGAERYAIPQGVVNEAVEIDPTRIVRVEGGELISFRGDSLPLIHLSRLFNLATPERAAGSRQRFLYGLVIGEGAGRVALVVDRVVDLREVVVRTITDPLVAQPGIAGATELGDGSVVLILDVPDLLRFAKRTQKNAEKR